MSGSDPSHHQAYTLCKVNGPGQNPHHLQNTKGSPIDFGLTAREGA